MGEARTFEDIRQDATNVLSQLEKGEIYEDEARDLLEDFEQEALLIHQKRNAKTAEEKRDKEQSMSSSTPPPIETKSPSQSNLVIPESEKSTPSGAGFLRRLISFSWLWDIILFLCYSALVIGGIAIAVVVYEAFRGTTRSIAHATQNRNPILPQRPQQSPAITIPHSGEIPNHLC
jgi:transcriptional antiterminator Rof (Rho-off)